MKLLRTGAQGQERPAILHSDGTIRDLSGVVDDIAHGTLLPEGLDKLRGVTAAKSASSSASVSTTPTTPRKAVWRCRRSR